MSLALTNRLDTLRDRAHMLKQARLFFEERGVLEVDVPLMTQKAPLDLHIDLVQGQCMGRPCYLQSSPEYGMKRLLAEGLGDIYQLSHVVRNGERGDRHNPEFVMVEWYRIGLSFEKMMEETLEFLQLFIPEKRFEILKVEEALEKFGMPHEKNEFFFAEVIEPQLGRGQFTILIDFPKEEAALAKVVMKEGKEVALRFEIFYQGMELANGYEELTCPYEQKLRFENTNRARKALRKEEYPIDDHLLAALEKGLPPMCGVACGFDRLMMLKHSAKTIEEVIPFPWEKT